MIIQTFSCGGNKTNKIFRNDHVILKTDAGWTENSTFPSEINYILKYIKLDNSCFKLHYHFIIFPTFYCIFHQINVALVSIGDFLQHHFKTLTNHKLYTISGMILKCASDGQCTIP